jgi:excisionase family DNA binding protein
MNELQQDDRRLVDKGAVAKLLSVSVRQVERLTAQGKIPGARKVGNSRRYHLKSVLAWLERGPDR